MHCSYTLLAVGLASAIGIAALAATGYPPPSGDVVFFLPPAIHWAASGQLWNPVAALQPGLTSQAFDYHGPLTPIAIGTLMWDARPQTALMVCGALNALTMALFAVSLWLRARARPPRSFWPVFVGVLAISGLATNLLDLSGRPETLARVLVALGLVIVVAVPERLHALLLGALLGLLALAHPIAAILSGALCWIWLATRTRSGRALARVLGVSAIAAVATASTVFVAVVPLRWDALASGLLWHATAIKTRPDTFTWHALATHWFLSPTTTGYLFVLVAASAFAVRASYIQMNARQAPAVARAIALLAAAAALVIASLTAFRLPATAYNVQFTAAIWFFLLYTWSESDQPRSSLRAPQRLLGRVMVACVLSFCSVGMARSVLLFGWYWQHGTPLHVAQSLLERERGRLEDRGTMTLSCDAFMLVSGRDADAVAFDRLSLAASEERFVIVERQTGSGARAPGPWPGYRVVFDGFSPVRPVLWGIALGNTVPGYGFAIYERNARDQ